jgi:hypothetical protein
MKGTVWYKEQEMVCCFSWWKSMEKIAIFEVFKSK